MSMKQQLGMGLDFQRIGTLVVQSGGPASVSPVVWYRADAEAYADLALVDTLRDQSENGNDATAAGTARPTFRTNILNGKPVIRFNGTTNVLKKIAVNAMSATEFTYYIVVGNVTGSAFGNFLSVANQIVGLFAEIRCNSVGTFYTAIGANGVGIAIDGVVGAPFKIVGSSFPLAGGQIGIYLKDLLQHSIGETGVANAKDLGVGARSDSTLFVICDIAEVLCYNSILSGPDRTAVSNYLATKYAL